MGYLTLIRIYNDGMHNLLKNSKDFCRRLFALSAGGAGGSFNHENLDVRVLRPIHSNDSSIYFCDGEIHEMSPYSEETRRLAAENPDYFKKSLKAMKMQIRELEKMAERFSE